MNKLLAMAGFGILLGSFSRADAAVITFDELSGSYSSIVYGDVTFTNNFGDLNTYSSPGAPLSGVSLLGPDSHDAAEWNIATFASGLNVTQVAVDLGDFGSDFDTFVMEAYNSSDMLLGAVSAMNDASVFGGLTLNLSSSQSIAKVLFGEKGNNDYATGYPGSALFDNFTYTISPVTPPSVPEPSSIAFMGLGLLSFFGLTRLKRSPKPALISG